MAFFFFNEVSAFPEPAIPRHAYYMGLYFCIQEDCKQNYRESLRLGAVAAEGRGKKRENLGRPLGGGGI